MDDICILVTTFLRDKLLYRCVESIRQYYPQIKIFIGDNGHESKKKDAFCRDHKCTLFKLPFDCGVGGTRNEALSQIPKQYKYIAIIEDDIVFTEATDLDKWKAVLDKEKDVGIVGGLLKKSMVNDQHFEANIWIEDETHYIKKIEYPDWKKIDGIRYFLCDLILNVFMMKRKVWDTVKWDPQFKTALEHADFFLRLKYEQDEESYPIFKNGKPALRKKPIRVAYTPDVDLYHKHEARDPYYMQYRARPIGWHLFSEKWKVKFLNSSFNKVNPVSLERFGKFYNIKDKNLELTIRILEKHECKWWLDAGTCLGAIRDGNFIESDADIDIGLPSKYAELSDVLDKGFKEMGFKHLKPLIHDGKKLKLTFKKDSVNINLYFYYKHKAESMWHGELSPKNKEFLPYIFSGCLFKNLTELFFRGKRCFVPNPPEQYLEERYGKLWETPNTDYKSWLDCKAIDSKFFKKNKLVFVGGIWDLFHAGHLDTLERARKLGNKLIVGIQTDEATRKHKDTLVFTYEQRKRIIESLRIVDKVIEQNDKDPTADLKKLRIIPDYLACGGNEDCLGKEYIEKHKGKVVNFPYVKDVNTHEIKKKIQETQTFKKPEDKKQLIAIGIKTFLRDGLLFKTIKAIEENFPYPYKLYIADDGRISDKKEYFYQQLEMGGHKIFKMPFNSGISVGRNKIIAEAKEDYILIMDDDIAIEDGESIKKMKKVLTCEKNIGLCASLLYQENGSAFGHENYIRGIRFERKQGLVFRFSASKDYYKTDGILFAYADQVVNFFLAKKAIFKDVRWDDRIKVEWEHMDFFFNLQKTDWKATVCLDAQAIHFLYKPEHPYNQYRRAVSNQYFFQKHKIHGVINRF